jgi:BolA protein
VTTSREAHLRDRLQQALAPLHLEIEDESERHRGHSGAAAGGGHFRIVLVAAAFRDRSLLERHRAVHAALGELLGAEVHALTLSTFTPEEWAARRR